MNVVDSSLWIEYLADTEKADLVAATVENFESLIVPSICFLEVYKIILRRGGEEKAVQASMAMCQGQVVSLDEELALRAANSSLPLFASIIWATAQAYNATLWTMDSHFAGMPKVRYFSKT